MRAGGLWGELRNACHTGACPSLRDNRGQSLVGGFLGSEKALSVLLYPARLLSEDRASFRTLVPDGALKVCCVSVVGCSYG